MHHATEQDYDSERRRRLLSGVPFFNEIAGQDAQQFQQLLTDTTFQVAHSGERVIQAGDVDSTLYFLLRGQLEVLPESHEQAPLYYVSPGEVFGSLSMLLGTPRSASIQVADAAREAVLASVDYALFSDADKGYSLATRLAFFRMIVHHIRWTLEVKRMQTPDHELVHRMRKLPIFRGEKGSENELHALKEQAQALAELLCCWNAESVADTGNLQLT